MNWLLICAGLGGSLVAFFLSYRGKSLKVKVISFCLSAIIWVVTAVGQWYAMTAPRLHLGLLGPRLSVTEAYDIVKKHDENPDRLQLLEATGSYYTCVRKPDTIFLQFCEWVFVFHDSGHDNLIEYRILDSRLPELLVLSAGTFSEGVREGGFATYVTYNISPKALGFHTIDDEDSAVHQYDAQGRDFLALPANRHTLRAAE